MLRSVVIEVFKWVCALVVVVAGVALVALMLWALNDLFVHVAIDPD